MIFGQVHNNGRLHAAFPFFTGMVGVQRRESEGVVEIAFPAPPAPPEPVLTAQQKLLRSAAAPAAPPPPLFALPADGTLDDEPMTAISYRISAFTEKLVVVTLMEKAPA